MDVSCTDSRGIRRGACVDPTCPCPSYNGGSDKKKCIKCGHPPGKHQHLDNPSANIGTPSGIMPNSSHTGYHIAPPQPPPDLPLCTADGCTNKVWYEFDLREAFDYCSPECRDRHLLSIKNLELEEELVAMRLELENEARKDSPKMMQRQQSNGRSQASRQQLPPQGHSSPPKSPTTSSTPSPSTSAKAGSKPGKTKEVTIEKKARKPSGLILSKKPYMNDKEEVVGFVIVGVIKDAPVYSKFQDDQIRLLDVIETINDTPCDKLFLPHVDLQERFEHSIDDRGRIKLVLNHCIALPPISRPLAVAKKLKYTHVTVLMYSVDFKDDVYGLSLSHECKVREVVTNSPGDSSRVKFDDKIAMYAVVSQDENEIRDNQLMSDKKLQLTSLKLDMQAAHRSKKNVILFIKKSEDITFI